MNGRMDEWQLSEEWMLGSLLIVSLTTSYSPITLLLTRSDEPVHLVPLPTALLNMLPITLDFLEVLG